MTSLAFSEGTMASLMPADAAASSLAVAAPMGSTRPRTFREPVMATSCLTGMSSRAERMTVVMVMDAESPSTPS